MHVFEIMKENDFLNWNVLLIGLERGWCDRTSLIEYAELCIAQTSEEQVDLDLIRIIFDDPLNEFDLKDIVQRIIKKSGNSSANNIVDANDKWRYAFLVSLLKSDYSYDDKIEHLEDIYFDFDCPDDMYSCLIYNSNTRYIPPLVAAKQALEGLKVKLNI